MSKEAVTWASSQKIADQTLRSVLHSIAFFANKGSAECTKSQKEIAQAIGASERTVRYALATLERLEIISRRARSNGFSGRTTDAIILSTARNFDVSKASVIALRKSCNRQNLPPQPAKSAGVYNTVNTEDSLSVGKVSVGSKGTYTGEGCESLPTDRGNLADPKVIQFRPRGAL